MDLADKYDVVIFGAGPAGLAAGLKLVEKGKSVLIVERDRAVGGISKTIEFQGCRFDLGGHRFFTKSKMVEKLWKETLGDDFMLLPRLSRIYYNKKFFDYPIKIGNALKGLGITLSGKIILSYAAAKVFPYREEKNLEQWVSNRFGKKLFSIFFKTYTEKLWGISCDQIQAEWAAQRIKGLSLMVALKNAFLPKNKKSRLKTLIDEFNYPRYGAGMMYEKMAERFRSQGGHLLLGSAVSGITVEKNLIRIVSIETDDGTRGVSADHFISSMPITELMKNIQGLEMSEAVRAADKLNYRSVLMVNLIFQGANPFPDNWIYVHSPEVKLGRIQNFTNWGPSMVPEKDRVALCLEYFCDEDDEFWCRPDEQLIQCGLVELEKINLGRKDAYRGGFVVRVPKAYPVYDAEYPWNLKVIREQLAKITNLQPVGRYGMFKYNNMDHSILTGIQAAENVLGAQHDLWALNTDREYHEEQANC